MRPLRIKQSLGHLKLFRDRYTELEAIIKNVGLTDKATRYYATWVDKADRQQLQQFPDRHKAYLHLLAFIKHQYFARPNPPVNLSVKAK